MGNGPYIATLASGVPIPGPVGPRGPQGPIGLTGSQGPVGATGPQGPVGATGPQGQIGPQGPIGSQGSTGLTGPQGPQGLPSTALTLSGVVATPADLPTGVAPGTCYYVSSTGTVFGYDGVEWVDMGMIQGPAGAPGATGATGGVGPTGPAGATGPTGPAGPTGATGATGAQGPQGVGIQVSGVVSDPTKLPTSAQNGTVYYVQSTGHLYVYQSGLGWTDIGLAAGPPGPAGPQGPTGATGAQGPAGSAGQMQSPWLTAIDASAHQVTNVLAVAIGTTSTQGVQLNVVGLTTLRGDMNGWNDFAHAQLDLVGVSDSRKQLWVGMDTTGNNGVIQPGISGVSWNNLLLNPSGGKVGINTPTPQAPLHVYGRSILQTLAGDPWCAAIQGSGGTAQTWLGTDGSGNLEIADTSGAPHFYLTQSGVASINSGPFDPSGSHLQVQGGVAIQGYETAGNSHLRIVNGAYGVYFRNDGGAFSLQVTAANSQWGGYTGASPFIVDLASHCVGIRELPNTSYGLSVDSINVQAGLTVNGGLTASGGITTNNINASGTISGGTVNSSGAVNCQSLYINGVAVTPGIQWTSYTPSFNTGGAPPQYFTVISATGQYNVSGNNLLVQFTVTVKCNAGVGFDPPYSISLPMSVASTAKAIPLSVVNTYSGGLIAVTATINVNTTQIPQALPASPSYTFVFSGSGTLPLS